MLTVIRMGVVAFALATVPFTTPHFFAGPRGVANAIALGVATAAWIAWMFAKGHDRVFIAALVVLGVSGGVLAGLSELSMAIAIGCVVTSTAAIRLRPELSLAITAETVAAFLIAGLAGGASAGTLVGYPCAFIGLWAFGLTRHAFMLRAEEAERMLEQTRRVREAETQAAALAERARIAREIHDVLAHSLAAVSVNLQAAEGLLSDLPDKTPELTKAIECIERAGVFTREGLTEARRAINALRDNTSPLPEQLKVLAAQHGAAGDAEVDFAMSGSPRPLPADANLTAYRTAQEALTNARKHSPGQPVRVRLEFAPAEITLLVSNPMPSAPADPRPSLAGTGGGHGLTGLRERAALSAGTLTAGPADGQWQVCLRIPA
jgi:signal transduction histidine kinase